MISYGVLGREVFWTNMYECHWHLVLLLSSYHSQSWLRKETRHCICMLKSQGQPSSNCQTPNRQQILEPQHSPRDDAWGKTRLEDRKSVQTKATLEQQCTAIKQRIQTCRWIVWMFTWLVSIGSKNSPRFATAKTTTAHRLSKELSFRTLPKKRRKGIPPEWLTGVNRLRPSASRLCCQWHWWLCSSQVPLLLCVDMPWHGVPGKPSNSMPLGYAWI